VAHEHSQVLILVDVIATPDTLQKRAMSKYFARIGHEVNQQVKLLRREVNLKALNRDVTGFEIRTKHTNL
jgi:hypothetical protein